MPRLTRRTFLAGAALTTACGGTAPTEALFYTPAPENVVGRRPALELAGVRYLLVLTGQSNAVGRAPAQTTEQPFSNQLAVDKRLMPLIEVERESVKSAAANMLTHLSDRNALRAIAFSVAANNRDYAHLKKGSPSWTRMTRQIESTKKVVDAETERLHALALMVIHGPSDHVAGNTRYASNLAEWQADADADIRARTGQSDPVLLITDQMSNWTKKADATSLIALAQLRASEESSGKIVLVGPKYQYGYEDGLHLQPPHYQWHGEQYGKVMKRLFLDGETWRPLSPREVRFADNATSVRARFWVPNPPIVFDTQRVPEKANMGFELAHPDPSVPLPAIAGVRIVDAETVEVRFGAPLPSGSRLRYAHTGTPGAWAGSVGELAAGSARGNLRDSDSTRSFHSSWELFNWCVHFDMPIS